MGLAQNVARVFSDLAVEQIDFNLGGLHIRPHMYRRVGDAMREDRIKVRVDPHISFDGLYNSRTNTMSFRTNTVPSDPQRRGLIIHEATHAIVDMRYCRSTTRLSSEVAAYLAQIIYLHWGADWDPPASNAFFHALYQFALDRGLLMRVVIRGTAQLEWDQYASIRDLVHHHGGYASYGLHQRVLANGL